MGKREFSEEDRFETADVLTLFGHGKDCELRKGSAECRCEQRQKGRDEDQLPGS